MLHTRAPHETISRFFSRNFAGQKEVAQYTQSAKRKKLPPRILYMVKLSFRTEREIKSFSDKQKPKGVHHHYMSLTRNVKGTSLG